MTSNKELSTKKINKEFEKIVNIVLSQMDLLNEIFESYKDEIPDKLIQKLMKNEDKIDKYEVKIDDQIIQSIVLYKPVASDLRQLLAVYRILISLERIGDLVIKINNILSDIKHSDFLKKTLPALQNMLKLVSEMVNRALLSFINHDKEYAMWTIKNDAAIDKLNKQLLKKALKKDDVLIESNTIIMSLTDLRSIISSIERIGDHATNIAEASLYALLGTNVRHQNFINEEF